MRLTFLLYLHQFLLINVNIVPTQIIVIVIYVKRMVVYKYVSSMSKPVNTKTVCKSVHIMSCIKPVIFTPVYKSLHASNICIGKTDHCSISTKPVIALVSSEPVKGTVKL